MIFHSLHKKKLKRKHYSLVIKGSFGWKESYMPVPVSDTAFCILSNDCCIRNNQESPLEYSPASRLLYDHKQAM